MIKSLNNTNVIEYVLIFAVNSVNICRKLRFQPYEICNVLLSVTIYIYSIYWLLFSIVAYRSVLKYLLKNISFTRVQINYGLRPRLFSWQPGTRASSDDWGCLSDSLLRDPQLTPVNSCPLFQECSYFSIRALVYFTVCITLLVSVHYIKFQ